MKIKTMTKALDRIAFLRGSAEIFSEEYLRYYDMSDRIENGIARRYERLQAENARLKAELEAYRNQPVAIYTSDDQDTGHA